MNTDLRKNFKNNFEEDFCKLMNDVGIGKTVKEEETILCQNQFIILQSFSQKIY